MTLRALKTEDELRAVPLDQPVLIELPSGAIEDDEPVIEAKKQEPKPKSEPTIDPDAKRLQAQLEAAQAAQRAADERAARAERAAQEAQARTQSLEGDLITGGLAAAQAERDAALNEYVRAGEAGDLRAQALAQSKIGRAEAKILNLEAGAAEVSERKPAKVEKTDSLPQTPTDPVQAIRSNPNLMPAEKTWLEAHPDAYMPGPRNNELSVAYERAIKQGLVRGSAEYFEYLEDFMGYKSTNEHRSTSVQAPPSRNDRGSDGRPSNGVSLDSEERLTAQRLGVSELDYAKQKQRLERLRRDDPERYK